MAPVVSITGNRTDEGDSGGRFMFFTVALSEPALDDVIVPFRVSGGSAAFGADFSTVDGSGSPQGTIQTGRVIFEPGDVLATVRVGLVEDTVAEPDESVVFEVLTPTNADLPNGATKLQAVGWILDDDGAPDPLSLYASDISVIEGDNGTRTIRFDVELSRDAPQNLTVGYTLGGSATAGADFVNTSGSFTINAGDDRASVNVQIRGDQSVEGLEIVDLQLDLPDAIETSAGGQATIVDDDGALPVVLVSGDRTGEGDTSGRFMLYSVALSHASDEVVTVPFRLVGGTAVANGDFSTSGDGSGNPPGSVGSGEVIFQPGETHKTVRFALVEDTVPEADESVVFEVFGPENAVLPNGATKSQAVGWIIDDDGTANPLSLYASDVTITEGDRGTYTATFSIDLSRPAPKDLSINYSFSGSASAGADFVAKTGTLLLRAGDDAVSLGVEIVGDRIPEGLEIVDLRLDLPDEIVSSAGGQAFIIDDDDDLPYVLVSGHHSAEGDINGSYMFYSVSLSAPSDEVVTVPFVLNGGTAEAISDYFASGDGSGTTPGSISGGKVIFQPGETQKTVRFGLAEDTVAETDESVVFSVFAPDGAYLPGGATRSSAVGWIMDDDDNADALSFFAPDVEIMEGDDGTRTATFNVEFSRPVTEDFTLLYSTQNGTAKAGAHYRAASGSIDVHRGETAVSIGVRILSDDTFGGKSREFSLKLDGAGASLGSLTAIAKILEDDFDPREANYLDFRDEPEGQTALTGAKDDTVLGSRFADYVDGGSANDELRGNGGDDVLLGGNGNDLLFGGAGDDRMLGQQGSDTLFGQDGADRMFGGSGGDVVSAGDGSDTLAGGSGADRLLGEAGSDDIDGQGGSDDIDGGGGDDTLSGGNGNDMVRGGRGDDRIDTGSGNDTVIAEVGDDVVRAGRQNDVARGGGGDDLLVGQGGKDTLNGNVGDDTLQGGGQDDRLIGGGGADLLIGGRGDDTLSGNAGFDTFAFAGAFGDDKVRGFSLSPREKIDLSEVKWIRNFNDLMKHHAESVGTSTLIDDDHGSTLTLVRVALDDLQANDFIF